MGSKARLESTDAMKVWRESTVLVEVGPYDLPLGYAAATTDTGSIVSLWHYRLRKARIAPQHGVVPPLVGKHVTVARANDGGLDVQTVGDTPELVFQAKRREMSALTGKLRANQPLTPKESTFVEFVIQLEQHGRCSDRVTWQLLKDELTRALADRDDPAKDSRLSAAEFRNT